METPEPNERPDLTTTVIPWRHAWEIGYIVGYLEAQEQCRPMTYPELVAVALERVIIPTGWTGAWFVDAQPT